MNNSADLTPLLVLVAFSTIWALCFLCVAIWDHIKHNAYDRDRHGSDPNIDKEQQEKNTEALQDAIDSGMSEKLNEGEVT